MRPTRSRLLSLLLPVLFAAGCNKTVVQGPPPPPPPPSPTQPAPAYAAQPPPPPTPPPAMPVSQPEAGPVLPPLDQLCAPIALYPDPLISLVLPASTFPDQIQSAARYAQAGNSVAGVEAMPWDASVKGLSHYPTVVEWMGSNLDWTSQLGGAFASEPAAVMDAIQALRRRARAVGSLATTPQQQVVVYQNAIQIEPVQAAVIYVPQYDPAVVYVQQPPGFDRAAFFGWSRPYDAGVWLSFGFDWHSHAVYTGDWYHYQQSNGGWSHPVNYAQAGGDAHFHSRDWQPPRNAPPPPPQLTVRTNVTVNVNLQARFAQPRVMAGAPPPPPQAVRVHAMEQNRPNHTSPPAPRTFQIAFPRNGAVTPAGNRPGHPPVPAPSVPAQRQPQPPARSNDEERRPADLKTAPPAHPAPSPRPPAAHPALTPPQHRPQPTTKPAEEPRHPAETKPAPQSHPVAASHPPEAKKPEPKKQPAKKQPPKTPEELERERRAQEAAQHPAPPPS